MGSQGQDAAIVGIHEYPSRDVEGRVSPLQIKAEAAARALEDAGLSWSDVDAIYDAGEGGGMGGLTICGLSDAAAWPVQSYIKKFRGEFEALIRGGQTAAAD